MIIEVILLIIILYVYTIFRSSWQPKNAVSDESLIVPTTAETESEESDLDAPVAPSILVTTTSIESPASYMKITKRTPGKISITSARFDLVTPSDKNEITLPSNYDQTSEADRRKFKCLAIYRSMINVLLDQIVSEHHIELSFNQSHFIYNDSDHRIIDGNTFLGDIPSIITPGNRIKIAKFQFHLDLNYAVITEGVSTVRKFILRFITAIATLINCHPKFIQVVAIENDTSENNNINVNFSITTRSEIETKKLADQLQNKVASRSALQRDTNNILQHIRSNRDVYKLESVLVHLQLQKPDFDPDHNLYYRQGHPRACQGGGRPYYFPVSWYRHVLKVKDEYPRHELWLGGKDTPEAWPVAYHGTGDFAVKNIVKERLLQEKFNTEYYKQKAIKAVRSEADVKGIYLATHCAGGASKYAKFFSVKNNAGKITKYKMVFQCRIEPDKYTEYTDQVSMLEKYYRSSTKKPFDLV